MADDVLKMALAGPMDKADLTPDSVEAEMADTDKDRESDIMLAFEDFEAGETPEDRLASLRSLIELITL